MPAPSSFQAWGILALSRPVTISGQEGNVRFLSFVSSRVLKVLACLTSESLLGPTLRGKAHTSSSASHTSKRTGSDPPGARSSLRIGAGRVAGGSSGAAFASPNTRESR